LKTSIVASTWRLDQQSSTHHRWTGETLEALVSFPCEP
jgi:hypothetical protein